MKFEKLFVVCIIIFSALSQQMIQAQTSGKVEIKFNYEKRAGIASNQFAVWIEDEDGNFIKTLYVTRFTGNGGYKKRPDALPLWSKKHSKKM